MPPNPELSAVAAQLKLFNKNFERYIRLIETRPTIEKQLETIVKLNPDSKYILVFGEDVDFESIKMFWENLEDKFGVGRFFLLGGVKLEKIVEIPNAFANEPE